jgi:hypothetical protein
MYKTPADSTSGNDTTASPLTTMTSCRGVVLDGTAANTLVVKLQLRIDHTVVLRMCMADVLKRASNLRVQQIKYASPEEEALLKCIKGEPMRRVMHVSEIKRMNAETRRKLHLRQQHEEQEQRAANAAIAAAAARGGVGNLPTQSSGGSYTFSHKVEVDKTGGQEGEEQPHVDDDDGGGGTAQAQAQPKLTTAIQRQVRTNEQEWRRAIDSLLKEEEIGGGGDNNSSTGTSSSEGWVFEAGWHGEEAVKRELLLQRFDSHSSIITTYYLPCITIIIIITIIMYHHVS